MSDEATSPQVSDWLTLRIWLIGQALSGCDVTVKSPSLAGDQSIAAADWVLKRLAEEEEKKRKRDKEEIGELAASGVLPIYNEETIGRLLRKLNLACVRATESGDVVTAREAARFSSAVESAMDFAGIK